MLRIKKWKTSNSIMDRFIKFIRNVSIYKRLMISFLIITTIPNFLIGYFSYTVSSEEMMEKISSSSMQILKSVESNVDDKLKLYEALVGQIARNQQLIELLKECTDLKNLNDEESKKKYQSSKLKIGQLLYQFSLSNETSNIEILTNDDEFRQFNFNSQKVGAVLIDADKYRQRDNYQQAIKTSEWPLWTDTSREYQDFQIIDQGGTTHLGNNLTLLHSIEDRYSRKILGTIIVIVPTSIFSEIVDLEYMYDKNEIVFLSGSQGILMILNGRYTFNMPNQSILNEISSKQAGTIIKTIGQKEYILASRATRKADMDVVYMVEREKALGGIYKIRDFIAKVVAGCILCFVLIAYFVTLSISRPLNHLKQIMESVEEDGLEFEYVDHSTDEIGILGLRFNNMIRGLKNLMDSVIKTEISRKNEEVKRKQAELDALQMQIKDHFLYNTLDLIRWKAMFIENGKGTLSQMIEDFSSFLRVSTKKTNELVEISEEIEHLYAYLKVLRFKEEVNVELNIDIKDQSLLRSKITKLAFQPIVENALKHGFDDAEVEGVICLRIYSSGDDLLIEIRDNGKGMSKKVEDQLNDELRKEDYKSGSIGLRNVNRRIKLSFGKIYGLWIESEEGEYTKVIIHIPNIRDQPI